MIKRILILFFITGSLLILAGAWLFLGPATNFDEKQKFLYIHSDDANKNAVLSFLEKDQLIKRTGLFTFLANRWNVWQKLHPGKYKIENGTSIFTLARMLRNNRQEPVNLIVTKLRTKNDFAGLVGRKFETDSARFLHFLNDPKKVAVYGFDTSTIMTILLPDTYTYFWTATPEQLMEKLQKQHEKFWNKERIDKAVQLALTPVQVYILASIVEEETLQADEKSLIAGVYLNRLRKGMYLGADPTVKFAVGDFSLKRILMGHINGTASNPYNTYKNKGLPPGPICSPSASTIDAVLNLQPSNYLYFCARPDGSGRHAFAETDTEHLKNAKAYQEWLNKAGIR